MDLWSHSYYRDYEEGKEDYLVAMMKEINWDVVEARMLLAEKTDLSALYMIRPLYNAAPRTMLNTAQPQPPITQINVSNQLADASAEQNQTVPPTTPSFPGVNGNKTF
jgi:hypothetical protein